MRLMKLRLLLLRLLELLFELIVVELLDLRDMLMCCMQRRWFEAKLVIGLFELQVV